MNATSYSHYSSLHQAAVILKSLPKPQAATILSRLNPKDIKQVLEAVNELDHITADQITELLEKLSQQTKLTQTCEEQDPEFDRLYNEYGGFKAPQASPVAIESNRTNHPFGFMIDTTPKLREQVLHDEHPKNIAIVLSSLPPGIASSCMKNLEPVVKISVLKRLCELSELDKESIYQLGYELKLRHRKLSQATSYSGFGVQDTGQQLDHSNRQSHEMMIDLREQTDRELGGIFGDAIIQLDELLNLDDDEIKILLPNVDTSCWAPALKSSSLEVQAKVLNNMGSRPANILSQEVAEIGDLDFGIEHTARISILQAMKKLQKDGLIQSFD